MRFYPTPQGELLPSVTTILDATMPTKARAAIQKWSAREKEAGRTGEEARDRGTAVHGLRESYMLGQPITKEFIQSTGYPEDTIALFRNLYPHLTGWDLPRHVWCEKPANSWADSHGHLTYFDKSMGHVRGRLYSSSLSYAGCPDDVGYFNGKLTLSDLKTSKRLYYRAKPQYPGRIWYARKREGDEDAIAICNDYQEKNSGWHSFFKCSMQLVAYRKLAEECLGIEIEQLMIQVAAPERAQLFILTPQEVAAADLEWEGRLSEYLSKHYYKQVEQALA